MSDEVLVERRGAVQVITINRPQAKNALTSRSPRASPRPSTSSTPSDELRVGVLTGAGGTFSAGMDLKAFLRGESPAIEGRGLCGITQTPPRKPLIGAVEGWALAGGFELLLACDLVVAARTARFGVPEVKRSLVAAGGAALLLPPPGPVRDRAGVAADRRADRRRAGRRGRPGQPASPRRAGRSRARSSWPARSPATARWPSPRPSRSPAPAPTGRSRRAGRSRPS